MIEKIVVNIIKEMNKQGLAVTTIDNVPAGSYRMVAKAAIIAMREPTEEMIKAGNWTIRDWNKKCFIDMIDAALKE